LLSLSMTLAWSQSMTWLREIAWSVTADLFCSPASDLLVLHVFYKYQIVTDRWTDTSWHNAQHCIVIKLSKIRSSNKCQMAIRQTGDEWGIASRPWNLEHHWDCPWLACIEFSVEGRFGCWEACHSNHRRRQTSSPPSCLDWTESTTQKNLL